MSIHRIAAGAAALVLAAGAQAAAPVFADNFDANPLALNAVPAGWTVTDGTVDIIGPGLFDLLPGNGAYIDLDGSTGNAGVLSISLALGPGTYELSFDLAGNQRGSTDTAQVSFGTVSANYTLGSSAPFATQTLVFSTGVAGNYTLSFANTGGDNVGLLIDRVAVNAVVPEPASWALLGLGLAVVGAAARRRKA